MASKRAGSGKSNAGSGTGPPTGTLVNAVLVGLAVCYGFTVLVSRGRVAWPPNQLLAGVYTVSGALALVGPIVLARREAGGGLGELLWMTGGLLLWVFDALAFTRSDWRSTSWVTPIGYQTMGLTMLAVLVAGWRCRVSGRGWVWTNVTGWLLGLFWVGMALSTLWPAQGLAIAAR